VTAFPCVMVLPSVPPFQGCITFAALTQGFTLGSAVAPFQGC